MRANVCANCGASVPTDVQEGTKATCSFCGTEYIFEKPGAAVRPSQSVSGGAQKLVGCLFALSLVVTLAIGMGTWLLTKSVDAPPMSSTSQDSTTRVTTPRRGAEAVHPSELSRITRQGWFALSVDNPPGSYGQYDPIASLDWVRSIASQWSQDARLTRFSFTGVRADGMMDLSSRDDWSAEYRFVSPTLRSAASQMVQVSETEITSGFRVVVGAGQTQGLLQTANSLELNRDIAPEPSAVCSMQQVMETLLASGLPQRPTYRLAAYHRERQGWVWGVSDIQDVRLPLVNAEDCRVR